MLSFVRLSVENEGNGRPRRARGKQNNQEKELTDKEQELLHEMINTYQVVKVMSRFMRWLAFALFLFVIDLSRMFDALENIVSHFKKWLIKS
nr:hypothetical protein [Bartonella rattaustraliani]